MQSLVAVASEVTGIRDSVEMGQVASVVKPLGPRGHRTLDYALQAREPHHMSQVSLPELKKEPQCSASGLGDADPEDFLSGLGKSQMS